MIKITQFLKLLFPRNKALTLALIASLLVHILLLSKFVLTLPELDERRQAINVRLVNVQAMQKATPAPAIKAYQKPVAATPKPPQPEPEATVNEISKLADDAKVQEIPAAIPPITSADNMQPAKQAADQTASNALPEEAVVTEETIEPSEPSKPSKPSKPSEPIQSSESSESIEVANIAKKPAPQPYKQVETEFEVRSNKDTSAAGSARIMFRIDKNRTYMLTSVTQAKDLASLFLDTLTQISEGVVTDKGLLPSYYSYQYANDLSKTQSARFAWSDGMLIMRSAKAEKTVILSTGTQDSLSFMYQFMFTPPLESMEITMTNGEKLRTYSYNFQGEEQITTKLGELNTIHLHKSGDDEEKTELWLGIDYQYLPVKIRKTAKDGSFIEQTATSIYTISP